MKEKITVMSILLPITIIAIAAAMWVHVSTVKENLENIQMDLIYVEAGRMTRAEASNLHEGGLGGYESSESIHPEGAYLLAAPYIIIDVVLILIYVVKYRT